MIVKLRELSKDIRFWLAFFLLIRMVGITNAPLESSHNWRQSMTNMIARNFLEVSPDILYPRVDMAGNQTGIIASEFPVFNYCIYGVSRIAGFRHWYGRLINLLVSTVGIYFFYLLVKRLMGDRAAFNSSFLLTVSIWFAFSRKIMPDTFSVSLVIIGLYFCYDYLLSGSYRGLFFFFVFSAAGLLSKMPSVSVFAILFLSLFMKGIPVSRKYTVSVTAFLCLAVAGWWYFRWAPFLLENYHYQLYFPKGILEGWEEIRPLLADYLEKFYYSSLCSYLAFAFFLLGAYRTARSGNLFLIIGTVLVTVVFLLFTLKTGSVFPKHNYYVIPFTPVMALIAGIGLTALKPRYQALLLVLISTECIANQQHDFFIKEKERRKLTLEAISDRFIPSGDLIVINGGPSPQSLYFSHRKGWTLEGSQLSEAAVDSLHLLGAAYLVLDKTVQGPPVRRYPPVYDDVNYIIYRLD